MTAMARAPAERYQSVDTLGSDLRRYLDGFWSDVLLAYSAEIERTLGEIDARTDTKDH